MCIVAAMNNISNQGWQSHNGTQLIEHPEGLLFVDGEQGPHIVWKRDAQFAGQLIGLTIRFKPVETCDTRLHVRVWDGPSVCSIDMQGNIEIASALHASCEMVFEWLIVTIIYYNTSDVIAIGSTRDTYLYFNGGRPQFLLGSIGIDLLPRPSVDPHDPAVFVDVGARGGAARAVAAMAEQVRLVMFEPDAAEAARIQAIVPAGSIVFADALADRVGPRTLNITRHPGCSSLLEPNKALLADYPGVSSWFDVVGTAEVSCTTYAQLHSDGRAPAPDIIKVDVQGLEYEVLTGFGDLLGNCIGIELESHVYPLYHGQKLLPDLISLLADRGFKLAKLQSQGWF